MQLLETDASDSKIFFHANHSNRITIPLPPNRFPGLGGPNPNLVAKPDSKPLSPFKVHQVRVFDLHFQFRIGSKKIYIYSNPVRPSFELLPSGISFPAVYRSWTWIAYASEKFFTVRRCFQLELFLFSLPNTLNWVNFSRCPKGLRVVLCTYAFLGHSVETNKVALVSGSNYL